jgi:hypothetical protein
VVVSDGRTVAAVLAPIAVGSLFGGCVAAQDASAEFLPLAVGKDAAAEIKILRPEGIVIGLGADVGRVVPGEIDAFEGAVVEQGDIFLDFGAPAGAARVAEGVA